jgi:PAS domain S-box-containing protein
MTPHSIPPLIIASIAIFVSLCSFAVWYRQRNFAAALSLCATSAAFGLYDLASAGLYNVAEPAASVPWLKAQTIFIGLTCLSYIWFLLVFTGRTGKRKLAALAIWAALGTAAQLFLPASLTWVPERPFLYQGNFIFGVSIQYIEADMGIVSILQDASDFCLLGLALLMSLRLAIGTRTREVAFLAVALLLVIAAGLNDFAASLGLARTIYLIEYSWILPLGFVIFWVAGQISTNIELRRSLGESRETLNNFVEQSSESIVIVGPDDRVLLVNPAAEKLFCMRREEIVGKPLYGSMRELALSEGYSDAAAVDRKGEQKEAVLSLADGTKRYLLHNGFKIKTGDGFMVGSIGLDITKRKEAEERLLESLRVNRLLLRELNHRVKNNIQMVISLLNLKSQKVQDPASLVIFQECEDQLYAIALVHSMLNNPKDADEIDLKEYLFSIANNLVTERVRDGKLSLVFDAEECSVPAQMAISCGLIANELITNSLKHAFTSFGLGRRNEIRVSLSRRENGRVSMTVGDNGGGLRGEGRGIGEADDECASHLGKVLVEMLAQQIKGDLLIESRDGLSTTVEFAATRTV